MSSGFNVDMLMNDAGRVVMQSCLLFLSFHHSRGEDNKIYQMKIYQI